MPSVIRFGPFELDCDREELKRAGLVLRLPGQPFQVLRLLAAKPGELVTREEIQAAIWGDETHVAFEQGINTAIRSIRRVLGDNAEAPRYVRTIPRRGYVFIAAVEGADVSPAPEPRPAPAPRRAARSHAVVLGAAVLAAIFAVTFLAMLVAAGRRPNAPRAIAVAPFRIIGHDGPTADVFVEELRAAIGSLPPRYVTLVAAADGRADEVLEGTVQGTPDGVRVIVRAIDRRSKAQLWLETYERPRPWTEGLAIAAAHRVAQAAARRYVPPPRREALLRTKPSPRALELYRRARAERALEPQRAEALFAEALAEEPRFAEALSALSDVWAERSLGGNPQARAAAAEKTRSYARAALALQPRNAEAWSSLGMLALQRDFDLAAAENFFRRAIAADPGYRDAHYNLAIALTGRGRFDEALAAFAAARELDPVLFDLSTTEAQIYLHARRYEDALARFRESLALNRNAPTLLLGMVSVHVAQRQWAEAIAVAQTIAAQRGLPKRDVPATAAGFREVYRELESFVLDANRRGVLNDYAVATYYAQLGDRERALAQLETAVTGRAPSVSYMLVDPRLDPVRADPRFRRLVQGTRLGPAPRDLIVTVLQDSETLSRDR